MAGDTNVTTAITQQFRSFLAEKYTWEALGLNLMLTTITWPFLAIMGLNWWAVVVDVFVVAKPPFARASVPFEATRLQSWMGIPIAPWVVMKSKSLPRPKRLVFPWHLSGQNFPCELPPCLPVQPPPKVTYLGIADGGFGNAQQQISGTPLL